MEHRRESLERQLENKQSIIEQLIGGPKHAHPVVNKCPKGINDTNGRVAKEKKPPPKGHDTKTLKISETYHKANGKRAT